MLKTNMAYLQIQSSPYLLMTPEAIYGTEQNLGVASDILAHTSTDTPDDFLHPYRFKRGILSIPVHGMLINNCDWHLENLVTGYQYISETFKRGMDDKDVEAIVLDCNSPGGVAVGCFELSNQIYGARGEKPITAIVADQAHSAAFAIASAADRITLSLLGSVGSVGVVTTHMSIAEMLKKDGIEVSHIFAGRHKIDGTSTQKLSPEAKKRFQMDVDTIHSLFVRTISRNRGLLHQQVQATQALTYMGEKAVEAGFADAVLPPEEAFNQILNYKENLNMSHTKESNSRVTEPVVVASTGCERQGLDEAGIMQLKSEARQSGIADERLRIKSILECEAAEKRPMAAISCALNTDLDLMVAQKFLSTLPEENRNDDSGSTSFEGAMNQLDHPDVGSLDLKETTETGVLADYGNMSGLSRNNTLNKGE